MPFFKSHEVFEQFFNVFAKDTINKKLPGDSITELPFIPIKIFTGETTDFLLKYYKRSGESSIEDIGEYYPCIVIQDFQPEINKQELWGKNYVEGVIDSLRGMRERIILPLPMIYKFQVSVVTRRHKEIHGANDWFYENFDLGEPGFFTFNKMDTEDGFVGDIVPYWTMQNDVPREDNRFECAYDFTLKTYLHAKSKSYKFVQPTTGTNPTPGGFQGGNFEEMIEKIKIILQMQRFSDFERILQYEFELT